MLCQNMWHKLCIYFCLEADHVLKEAIALEKMRNFQNVGIH